MVNRENLQIKMFRLFIMVKGGGHGGKRNEA
jgi:hypothetical protein